MATTDIETVSIPPRPRIVVDTMGRGELVLLLHGLGGSRSGWAEVLATISRSFRAAAWDARGHGDSDDFDGPLSFTDLNDDILRVLNHFDTDRVHLVGQSLGGLVALDFCLRHPRRVASLTLAGFAGKSFRQSMTEDRLEWWLQFRRQPLLDGKELSEIASDVADGALSSHATAATRRRVIASVSASRRVSYLKGIEALLGYDREIHLEAVHVPTLMVVGQDDRIVAREMVKEAVARIPNAQLAVIEKAGHLTYVENPGFFSDIVESFLRRARTQANLAMGLHYAD